MNLMNLMAQELGWVNAQQAVLRYSFIDSFVNPGDIVIDIGAGYGFLGDYIIKVSGKSITYIPVEPHDDFYSRLVEKYPHAIKKSLFHIASPSNIFGDILPADVVVASGVIAELSIDRTIKLPVDQKEKLFIKLLLSIPSKTYIFDIWDKHFFRRRGGDTQVRVSDPGLILNYVEENLNKEDKVFYLRPIKDDYEASFFVITKK